MMESSYRRPGHEGSRAAAFGALNRLSPCASTSPPITPASSSAGPAAAPPRQGHEVVDHGPTSTTRSTTTRRSASTRRQAVVARPGGRHRGPRRRVRRLGQRRADRREQGARYPRRAGLEPRTAELAREHNDANVISIGARQHTVDEAIAFIDAFIADAVLRRGAPRAADRPARRVRGDRHHRRARGRLTPRRRARSVDPEASYARGPLRPPHRPAVRQNFVGRRSRVSRRRGDSRRAPRSSTGGL